MKKLVIIPAYNEGGSILRAVEDIKTHAPGFDYIVINDCSTDDTLEVCRKHGLNYVNLSVNLGIGGAVQTGYLYGCQYGYDLAVQFDGDGQHDGSYLERMAEELLRTGSDMVIGSRFIEKEGFQSSGLRRVGIRYFSALIRLLTGKRVTDPTSGMRMVNRDVMELYARSYPKDYPEPESVTAILRMGKKVTEIPVVMKKREEGTSSIGGVKSVYYMIKVTLAVLMERLRG
ncbi:MAG: glycosyltransferase family 2 protein [Lachnospiraceae bacterium]|nr:glycosyltransferase family 2 protein [Lachnospiraceae bacterium]MCI9659467.1 glycosyltransferase family 2 protein [Lachnospiraceae bacterium]